MKILRTIILLALLLLSCTQLPATNVKQTTAANPIESKMAQADTVRMTCILDGHGDYDAASFVFNGEEGKTYKVVWGDGETDTYTGKGLEVRVECHHVYSISFKRRYNILLFGVIEEEK